MNKSTIIIICMLLCVAGCTYFMINYNNKDYNKLLLTAGVGLLFCILSWKEIHKDEKKL